MCDEYFRKFVVVSCVVDDIRELVILLEIKWFLIDLLFLHEIGIILIDPLHPTVAVH